MIQNPNQHGKASADIYIYGLRCPIAGQIRYIGKSNWPKERVYKHLQAARTGYYQHRTARWLAKLQRLNLEPTLEILCQVPSGENWQEYERRYIKNALEAGLPLTNGTLGGEGVVFASKEDEARAKAARKAGFSDGVKKRMSASIKASWANPERRANNVAKMKEWAATPAARAHLIRQAKRPRSEEAKERRRQGLRVYWANKRAIKKPAITENPTQLPLPF